MEWVKLVVRKPGQQAFLANTTGLSMGINNTSMLLGMNNMPVKPSLLFYETN